MAEIRVRNLPDDIKVLLKDQASRRGQNLEVYLRHVLAEHALQRRREWADRLKARRDQVHAEHGTYTDSADLIREDRDARG